MAIRFLPTTKLKGSWRRAALFCLAIFVAVASTLAITNLNKNAAHATARVATAGAIPASTTISGITVSGVDLHDGTVAKLGDTYYLYGTMYGCGFHWGQKNTPWCGFGVATAPSLNGPWSTPQLLFSPNDTDPYTHTTWASDCGATGAGCFNPRMVQRTWGPKDNVNMLYFNAPADYWRDHSNAYYVMGCNGPAGPCGATAGAPYGSTHKPAMYMCNQVGDFSIVTDGTNNPYIFCTYDNQTLAEEQLNYWGTDGVNGTGSNNLAGVQLVEGVGAYHDTTNGKWIMTYSDADCGYCGADGTGYATADSITGPWTAPTTTGKTIVSTGRRDISATSCGGQPRTIFTVDNQPYQFIDLWSAFGDYTNQTNAGQLFMPLTYTPKPQVNAGDPWLPQFAQWPCS